MDRPRDLNLIQRWLHSVISHPDGVIEGSQSAEALKLIALKRDELEQVIRRSNNLSAEQRLGIYANAYYARLLECLRGSFPILRRALGEEVFNEFGMEYLQRYPPRSYTLNRLADRFGQFLEETRPADGAAGDGVDWPDFLIDLARLEWTIEQVFDGPGSEQEGPLDAGAISAIASDRFAQTRLMASPSLQLLSFKYPANSYYSEARKAPPEEEVPIPGPCEQHLAVWRRDYVVRRMEISRPQLELLIKIVEGKPLGAAIDAAADAGMSDAALARDLREWFRSWTEAGLFIGIQM